MQSYLQTLVTSITPNTYNTPKMESKDNNVLFVLSTRSNSNTATITINLAH